MAKYGILTLFRIRIRAVNDAVFIDLGSGKCGNIGNDNFGNIGCRSDDRSNSREPSLGKGSLALINNERRQFDFTRHPQENKIIRIYL